MKLAILGGLLAALFVQAPYYQQAPPPATVGVNLARLHYGATDHKYADLTREMHPFADPVGPTGWPLTAPSTTLLCNARVLPAGDYPVSWSGSGTLKVSGTYQDGSRFAIPVRGAGGFTLAMPTAAASVTLSVASSDPADPLRDASVLLPGYAGTGQAFTEEYLASLAPFKVLRFMDWARTNDSPQVDWADRTPAALATATTLKTGGSWESVIELANATDKDVWINVPHLATDDYVRRMACLFSKYLRHNCTVHLEYSNEVWNNVFGQSKYAQQQGLNAGLDTDIYTAGLKFTGRRAGQVFRIFKQYCPTHNVVGVLAGQWGNPYTVETSLKQLMADGYSADALAGAPYLYQKSMTDDEVDASWASSPAGTLDTIFAGMSDYMDAKTAPQAAANAALSAKYGLPYVCYEAGQSLVASLKTSYPNVIDAYAAANKDPRMGAVYDRLAAILAENKITSYNLYAHIQPDSKFGTWGLKSDITDPEDTPKWAAALRAAGY